MLLLTPWGEHPREFGQTGQVSHLQRLPCQCEQVANLGVLPCAPCASTASCPLAGMGEAFHWSAEIILHPGSGGSAAHCAKCLSPASWIHGG